MSQVATASILTLRPKKTLRPSQTLRQLKILRSLKTLSENIHWKPLDYCRLWNNGKSLRPLHNGKVHLWYAAKFFSISAIILQVVPKNLADRICGFLRHLTDLSPPGYILSDYPWSDHFKMGWTNSVGQNSEELDQLLARKLIAKFIKMSNIFIYLISYFIHSSSNCSSF